MKANRKFGRAVLALVFLAVLMTAGCDWNKTIRGLLNCIGVAVDIKVPENVTREDLNNLQYAAGLAPDTIIDLGGGNWQLKFHKPNQGGTSMHIGANLPRAGWVILEELLLTIAPGGDTVMVPQTADPNVELASNPTYGRAISISNQSESLPVRIQALQWAISDANVPLDSLLYHGPRIDAMTWNSIYTSPIDLLPGQSDVQDVPDDAFPANHYIYCRYLTTNLSNADTSEIIFKSPVSVIPTLSQWGMIIMGLLIIAISTAAVVRRRKLALRENMG